MTKSRVVALVAALSAAGGAIAGAVAALVAAAVLTPAEPVTAAQIALMAAENAVMMGLAGAALGTVAAFGALRRVPLGRLVLCTGTGALAGLLSGWLGGFWAWHNFNYLAIAGFGIGALVAHAFSAPSSRSTHGPGSLNTVSSFRAEPLDASLLPVASFVADAPRIEREPVRRAPSKLR